MAYRGGAPFGKLPSALLRVNRAGLPNGKRRACANYGGDMPTLQAYRGAGVRPALLRASAPCGEVRKETKSLAACDGGADFSGAA